MNGNVSGARQRSTIPYSAAPQLVSPAAAGSSRRMTSSGTTPTPLDFDGHGTHVSGTIGQLTNDGIGTAGIAYNVKLMPVKVLASEWDLLFAGSPNSNVGGSDDSTSRAASVTRRTTARKSST